MITCDYHLFTQNFLKKLSSAVLIKMEILLSDKSLYTPKDSVVSCQLKKKRDNVVGSMNSTNQVRDFHFKTSRSSGNCLEQESSFWPRNLCHSMSNQIVCSVTHVAM